MENLYQVLEIEHSATADEIKAAYRRLAKKYHPDKCSQQNAEELFIEITEAYEILSNPVKRRHYDLTRQSPSPRKSSGRAEKHHEDFTQQQRKKARRKAKHYSQQKFERFENDYFDSIGAYLFPKLFSCLGMGLVGFIFVLMCSGIIMWLELSPGFLLLPVMIAILGSAAGSTYFDMWHNAKQKKKVKQRR